MAHRLVAMGRYPEGITTRRASGVHWSGKVIVADKLQGLDSLPKRKPARVFVTSMADLFHESVPSSFIKRVFLAMSQRSHLTFQALTKRPDRAGRWWWSWCADRERRGYPAPLWPANVWMGTTVEDQERAHERIPHLLELPAPVRFLSCEPLLGPLDLHPFLRLGIHWVITGGESGARARPTPPAYFRELRRQCEAEGTAFFFKQWGEWVPHSHIVDWPPPASTVHRIVDLESMARVGRQVAGNVLDGKVWQEFPDA